MRRRPALLRDPELRALVDQRHTPATRCFRPARLRQHSARAIIALGARQKKQLLMRPDALCARVCVCVCVFVCVCVCVFVCAGC